jgi:hypothetical protein
MFVKKNLSYQNICIGKKLKVCNWCELQLLILMLHVSMYFLKSNVILIFRGPIMPLFVQQSHNAYLVNTQPHCCIHISKTLNPGGILFRRRMWCPLRHAAGGQSTRGELWSPGGMFTPLFIPRCEHSLMFRKIEGRTDKVHPWRLTSPQLDKDHPWGHHPLGSHCAPRGYIKNWCLDL